MDTITLLQHYWWLIISLLGALLVFLMFVQGGQALLYTIGRTEEERNMLVNSLGRKWELTFTTLVTFGGAFFASFPLFYSTSFGGAFYVWMAILLCFVIQAVAYEYRRKPGNVFGERTFNAFLLVNGVLGPLLIGTAVGTFFTGAEFTVDRLNLANQGGAAVISQWATPWHGLEAVAEWRNVLLGLSVTLLAMTLACQYFMNNIDDEAIFRRAARRMRTFAVLFVACFVAWLLALVLADENAGGITGGNTNAKAFVINCYSWMESLVSSGPNTGGIIGYGGSDSFAVNCYTTTATVVSGGMYGGAVGYVKKSNLQNIYGNSAVGVAVGRAKNTGSNVPSVWPTQTSRALSLGEMMSGSVSVPSNNTEYGSFVEALNAGVDIFNSATFSQKPEGVVLRRWKSSGTYPVLAD